MGTGKTYSTKYLLDSNNNSGADGQVLTSTSEGVNWSDGSDIIGGPYLPLTAGSTVPLTGALYLEDSSTDVVMSGNSSGNFTIDNTTGQIAFKANGSTVQSMIITSSQISLNEAVSVNSTSISSPNKLQVTGQARVFGQFMVGDSNVSNTAAKPIHVKQSGAATIRLEDSDNDNLAFDLIVDEGTGFKISETIGGQSGGDNTRLTIHETSGNVSIGATTEEGRLLVQDSGLGNTNGDSVTNTVMMGGRWDLLFKQIRTANETDWNNTTVRLQGRVDSTNMQSIDFATDDSYNRHIDINTASNSFNTRFTHDGRVGIGTNDPDYKLDVSGNGRFFSSLRLDAYPPATNAYNGSEFRFQATGNTSGTLINSHWYLGPYIDNAAGKSDFRIQNNYDGSAISEYFRIDSDGNVGIDKTNPIAKLDVNGSIQGTSFYNLAIPSPIMFPEGGTYNGSASETGYIVIKLPDTGGTGQNNMMTCLVRIYDYANNESFDVRFNGYFYGSSYLWTRNTVWIDSSANVDRNFTVRFGKELGGSGSQDRAVVTIGEASGTWSYPKVAVIQYTPGHSEGNQPQDWNSGCDVSVVEDYWDGTDNTLDDTITNNQVNNWRRNGQDLYYGSGTGNVGIGTTSPDARLDVDKSVIIGSESTATSTTNIENVLKVKGKNNYSDGTTWYGDYGQILLSATANMTASARQFLITNALDNNKFAIIRSVDAVTNPVTNSTSTGVNSGTADFVINNAGNIGIGTTSPDYLLDLYKSTATTSSSTGTTLQRLWNYVGAD